MTTSFRYVWIVFVLFAWLPAIPRQSPPNDSLIQLLSERSS